MNTWKNIKKSPRNNKFKILGIARDQEFELPGGIIIYQIFRAILSISSGFMRHLPIDHQFR